MSGDWREDIHFLFSRFGSVVVVVISLITTVPTTFAYALHDISLLHKLIPKPFIIPAFLSFSHFPRKFTYTPYQEVGIEEIFLSGNTLRREGDGHVSTLHKLDNEKNFN